MVWSLYRSIQVTTGCEILKKKERKALSGACCCWQTLGCMFSENSSLGVGKIPLFFCLFNFILLENNFLSVFGPQVLVLSGYFRGLWETRFYKRKASVSDKREGAGNRVEESAGIHTVVCLLVSLNYVCIFLDLLHFQCGYSNWNPKSEIASAKQRPIQLTRSSASVKLLRQFVCGPPHLTGKRCSHFLYIYIIYYLLFIYISYTSCSLCCFVLDRFGGGGRSHKDQFFLGPPRYGTLSQVQAK